MRVLSTALAMAMGAMASPTGAGCRPGFHCTNSHLHTEVRAYPLEREGHNRGSIKPLPRFEPDRFSIMSRVMELKIAERAQCEARNECPLNYARTETTIPCVNNKVSTSDGTFDCENIDLLGFVPIKSMDSDREASDIWGWTDPESGDQIAIIGMEDRTAFVKVNRNADGSVTPVVLATLLQSGTRNVIWSDMKVYGDHVFIVRESNHGMQVYDLKNLRQYYNNVHPTSLNQDDLAFFYSVVNEDDLTSNAAGGANATADMVVTSVHNIVINEASGFAYLVGSKTCRGGLHVVDIHEFGDEASPTARFAGCYSEDGYTHDAQCVIYDGPDTKYKGKEICWAYNEDTITLVDVSDKDNMQQISRVSYDNFQYTHQGWLTDGHKYVIANDELDEINTKEKRTRTLVWDYSSLEEPVLKGYRFSADDIHSVDHNLYINGNRIYLANYCSGLRVYEIGDLESDATLTEQLPQVAYFDSAPYCDSTGSNNSPAFKGSWSSYPYFKSTFEGRQLVIMSNIETGLFVLDVKP